MDSSKPTEQAKQRALDLNFMTGVIHVIVASK